MDDDEAFLYGGAAPAAPAQQQQQQQQQQQSQQQQQQQQQQSQQQGGGDEAKAEGAPKGDEDDDDLFADLYGDTPAAAAPAGAAAAQAGGAQANPSVAGAGAAAAGAAAGAGAAGAAAGGAAEDSDSEDDGMRIFMGDAPAAGTGAGAGVTQWAAQQTAQAAPQAATGDDSDDDDGMRIVLGDDGANNDSAWDPSAALPGAGNQQQQQQQQPQATPEQKATPGGQLTQPAQPSAAQPMAPPATQPPTTPLAPQDHAAAATGAHGYTPSANRYVRPELAAQAQAQVGGGASAATQQQGAYGGGRPGAQQAQQQQQQQQQQMQGGDFRAHRRGPAPAYVQYKNVFEVDLDALDEKPWARLGADPSDYFNYAFSEDSWKRYTARHRQVKLQKSMMHDIPADEANRTMGLHDPFFPQELAFAMRLRLPPFGADMMHPHRQLEAARTKRARDPTDALAVERLDDEGVRELKRTMERSGEEAAAAAEQAAERAAAAVAAAVEAASAAAHAVAETETAGGAGEEHDAAPEDDGAERWEAPDATMADTGGGAGAHAGDDAEPAAEAWKAPDEELPPSSEPQQAVDVDAMERKQLQALAKQNGVKANLATDEMRKQLKAKLSES